MGTETFQARVLSINLKILQSLSYVPTCHFNPTPSPRVAFLLAPYLGFRLQTWFFSSPPTGYLEGEKRGLIGI